MDKVKPGHNFASVHPTGSYFNNHKVDPNKPMPTLTFKGYGKSIIGNRIVNPDEAALLQSFPRDYKWIGKPSQIWQRIGYSVPPKLMKAIATHIKENILDKID